MRVPKVANVGIDYSKEKFNATVLFRGRRCDRQVPNNLAGGELLVDWLKSTGARRFDVAFEPTGRYSDAVSGYLWSQPDFRLFQINPQVANKYAASRDIRIKSDFKDAYALAQLIEERSKELPEWRPRTDAQQEMRDVHLRHSSLVKRIVTLKNQMKCGLSSELVRGEIVRELKWLEDSKESLLEYGTKIIDSDPALRRDRELLESIPGIGAQTAVFLLCLVDFRKFATARKLACFLGLTQRKHESGSSVHRRNSISKKGGTAVRSALFCPTWTAIAKNALIQEFYKRLVEAGKRKRVAEIACLRKLVTISWSLIRNQRPFDLNYVNPYYQPT